MTLVLGFLLSGVWFGCHILLQQLLVKKKWDKCLMFSPLFSALIPTVVIGVVFKSHPFHFHALLEWKYWLIAILTVCVTSLVIEFGTKREKIKESLYRYCIEAAMMEIPQRVMMQTFVCALLTMWGKEAMWGIVINGCIWCLDIIVQALIFKTNNYKELVIEIIASFIFSLGIGYVFFETACLLIPMLSHAAERYVTNKLRIV